MVKCALLVCLTVLVGGADAQAQVCPQVREVPNLQLNDIAMASMDAFGPVIFYNPVVVQQAGPLLNAFFRAHEYAHVCLGHVQQLLGANPLVQAWLSPQLELQADCAAAKSLRGLNPQALQAAIQLFTSQGPIQQRPTHPAGTIRAQNIAGCWNTP
jgi:hypothetical protein